MKTTTLAALSLLLVSSLIGASSVDARTPQNARQFHRGLKKVLKKTSGISRAFDASRINRALRGPGWQMKGSTLQNVQQAKTIELKGNKVILKEAKGKTQLEHLGRGFVLSTHQVGSYPSQRVISYKNLDVALKSRPTSRQLKAFMNAMAARPWLRSMLETPARKAAAMAVALDQAGIHYRNIGRGNATLVKRPTKLVPVTKQLLGANMLTARSPAELAKTVKKTREPIYAEMTAMGQNVRFYRGQKESYDVKQLNKAGVRVSLIGGDLLLFANGITKKRARAAGLSRDAIMVLEKLPTLEQYRDSLSIPGH